MPEAEWQRRFYDEDTFGRATGRVRDSVEAMRLVARSLDAGVTEAQILTAVESRRRRFELALTCIEPATLEALDRLRAADIRTAIVSDAGADDIECWQQSPLASRIDAVVFSCDVGVCKPHAGIYRHALAAIEAHPAAAMFVGDGGSNEHHGARALGMATVLVTRLLATWWPDRIESRRPHADWEFDDVAAFVAALDL